MNKLPKYWIVKNDGSQLFKDTVIKYLNNYLKNIYKNWVGDCNENYYGFDGNNSFNGTNNNYNITSFKNNPTLLSLDEFIELSKEEFILPEKWCIKTNPEIDEILINWRGGRYECPMKEAVLLSDKYWISSKRNFFSDYTEITFEQFKKYVLKQTDMKKIKYYKILKKVWGLNGTDFSVGSKLDILNKQSLPYFESLGLLKDTTIFEPVYEEEFKIGDVVYIKEAQNGAYGANNSFGIITDEKFSVGIINSLSLRVNIKGSVWGIGDPDKCDIRLATEKEVEEYKNNLLLEETKKRYPVGTKFISSYDNRTKDEIINGEFFWYDNNHIVVNSINGCSVYINGKWAEILPFPDITINGYKAKFSEDYVEFGCQKYSKKFVLKLNSCLQDNNFKMDYKDQIKQIAEYYNG